MREDFQDFVMIPMNVLVSLWSDVLCHCFPKWCYHFNQKTITKHTPKNYSDPLSLKTEIALSHAGGNVDFWALVWVFFLGWIVHFKRDSYFLYFQVSADGTNSYVFISKQLICKLTEIFVIRLKALGWEEFVYTASLRSSHKINRGFTIVNNLLIGALYFTVHELFSLNWKHGFTSSEWKKSHVFKISLLIMLPGETQVFLFTTGSISVILFHFSHACIILQEQHLAVRGCAVSCLC